MTKSRVFTVAICAGMYLTLSLSAPGEAIQTPTDSAQRNLENASARSVNDSGGFLSSAGVLDIQAWSGILFAEDSRTITPELLTALHNPDPRLRALAARAVGRIGDADCSVDSIRALMWPLLNDSSLDVADMAAFSLSLLPKDTAMACRLIAYAHTVPRKVASTAIISAGRVGDNSSTTLFNGLLEFLRSPDSVFHAPAAQALFLSGMKQADTALILTALTDISPGAQDTAMYALARLRMASGKDVYLKYFLMNDTNQRIVAMRGVEATKDSLLAPRVRPFKYGSNRHMRAVALQTLSNLGGQMAELALVETLSDEQDQQLRAQAIRGLMHYAKGKYSSEVFSQINDGAGYSLRSAIVAYLAAAQRDSLDPVLDPMLEALGPLYLVDFFDNLNRDLPTDLFRWGVLHYLPGADGPSYYSALTALDEKGVDLSKVATFSEFKKVNLESGDILRASALVDLSAKQKSSSFFQMESDTRKRLIKTHDAITEAGLGKYTDLLRSFLTGAESFLDTSATTPSADSNRKKVLELLEFYADLPEYIVSRDAAALLHRHFGQDMRTHIHKPTPHRRSDELASALQESLVNAKYVTIFTKFGPIVIELDYLNAPLNCLNFVDLVKKRFYDGLVFHRVILGFVTQGGDPQGNGTGGPGYNVRCEYSVKPYQRGSVGMATSGKDTGGSQFFVTTIPQPHLDARYTNFGTVVSDMSIVDSISQRDGIDSIRVSASYSVSTSK